MREKMFAELMDSAREALSHAKGKRDLRTTVLPVPPAPMSAEDVKKLRQDARASQAVFAHYLNVSTKLVQAWESERRTPEGAALKLLRVAESNPDFVFGAVTSDASSGVRRSQSRKDPKGARKAATAVKKARGSATGSRRSAARRAKRARRGVQRAY